MIYPSIRIEGAILSSDILDHLEEQSGQKSVDFGLDTSVKVKDEIARAWADAQDYWRIFQRKLGTLRADSPATTETRQQWITPLLGLLGYQLEFHARGAEVNGKIYAISHRVTNRAGTPLQIVGYREAAGLDRVAPTARMSAHALVQEYLNLSEQLYGIVTNGRVVRLLRDSSRLIKQSFVEFDLDRIFTDGLFADFAVLYRLIHVSRLPLTNDSAVQSWIERYHQDSLESGARIRAGLSTAVESAILGFANGFLSHPENGVLRSAIAEGRLAPDSFYKNLLRLIYRVLFLMVIEERDLVFPAEGTKRRDRDIYRNYYSLHRLRQLAERRYLANPRKHDLWLQILGTFRLFEANGPGAKLGIGPLAGDLFGRDAIGVLSSCTLGNNILLGCLRSLSVYEHPENRQQIRVNYGALNVEELGSVYEGLLKLKPTFLPLAERCEFTLPPGDDDTQSHYTPDDLVQPLLKHSLDYLIADRLKAPNPEAALLDLRVADIACGSGHILLAAARRIATELAVVRTGEEQPSPSAYRTALRDVIRNCIYGVDQNPLAVELCKVALWLEAHVPGQPLNFLDHHIKCGNSIVGFVHREELDRGVPDEAFATMPGDDKELATELRKKNKRERKDRERGQHQLGPTVNRQLNDFAKKWDELSALPERGPDHIAAKKIAFAALASSHEAFALEQIAAIPIAQFYTPKTSANLRKLITDADFRRYSEEGRTPQGEATAHAWATAREKRFFHWFLEFPDVIARGGFDCILGNPPYLGGTDLRRTYGDGFCEYVQFQFTPAGLSDLVVFFLRRTHVLLRQSGFLALITTNSVRDGRLRGDGLAQILLAGAQIVMAVRDVKWPGRANLVVSLVVIAAGNWNRTRFLDSSAVEYIDSFLEAGVEPEVAKSLFTNKDFMLEGSKTRGQGFFVSHETRLALISEDPRNAKVVLPILAGAEITDIPNQQPQRSAIFFADLPEERARDFSSAFAELERRVFAERSGGNDATLAKTWWRFERPRGELYKRLRSYQRCFAACATAKYLNFVECPTDQLFTHGAKVFMTDRWDLYAIVQSTVHEVWARRYSGSHETRLRYSPSDCFDTFAFPAGLWQVANGALAVMGERYHGRRKSLMLSLWLGLTDVYNLFHMRDLTAALVYQVSKKAPDEVERGYADILELRDLHRELDVAVRDAYGWNDLDLGHDFYEVDTLPENDRTRYTISPAARKEVLRRLLALNHEHAAAETAIAPRKKATSRKKHQHMDAEQAVLVHPVPSISTIPAVVPALSLELRAPLRLIALIHQRGAEAPRIQLARAFALLANPDLLLSRVSADIAEVAMQWAARIGIASGTPGVFVSALKNLADRDVVHINVKSEQTVVVATSHTPAADQIDPWFRFEAQLAWRAIADLESGGISSLDTLIAARDPGALTEDVA